MKYNYYFAVAQDYNCDAYGAGDYNECNSTAGASTGGTTQPSGGGDSGPLANTGYDIIVPIALGIAVIGASGVLLVKRLRRRNS